MEELSKGIEKFAQKQFNALREELNEYEVMYDNLSYGDRRNNMFISNKRFPTSISKATEKLLDAEYITRLLALTDFMKENNFNFFKNYEETAGYHHYEHGYGLKDIISNLDHVKSLILQVENVKDLLSEKLKEQEDEITENTRRIGNFLLEIDEGNLDYFLKTESEKAGLRKNLISLRNFDKLLDYKYSIIVMGSIIEFLLTRYCAINGIEPINDKGEVVKNKSARFVNYVEAAIKNDIFSEKDRWKLIQDYLRDFRNYIHINKEINSKEIDEDCIKLWCLYSSPYSRDSLTQVVI